MNVTVTRTVPESEWSDAAHQEAMLDDLHQAAVDQAAAWGRTLDGEPAVLLIWDDRGTAAEDAQVTVTYTYGTVAP
jgi:hypothetical protein